MNDDFKIIQKLKILKDEIKTGSKKNKHLNFEDLTFLQRNKILEDLEQLKRNIGI